MYLTIKQQLKRLTKTEYKILKELTHTAKNLTNEAIYNIRQYYFQEGKYLNYEQNYHLLKNSPNYKQLNSNMAQQILKQVDESFKSFFALIKLTKQKHNLPHYLPKDGHTTLIISFIRTNNNKLTLPYSNTYKKTHQPIEITIPPILIDKKIKEIRIIPKAQARFFEIQYVYETEPTQRKLNKNNALAIDLGINNLVTAVTSTGKTFIIDGRKLKSINQWFNKENARLQSIKDKQKFGKKFTNRQMRVAMKRNNRVNDYISKVARMVVDYCVENDIGVLVVGYSGSFQRGCSLGVRNNQNFVNIPYGRLLDKLVCLCELCGIIFVEQEESYTSRASFWDGDVVPGVGVGVSGGGCFSGVRVFRGLFRCADGRLLNADVNGALNILRKSNVVSLEALYSRGAVDTPVRIRVT